MFAYKILMFLLSVTSGKSWWLMTQMTASSISANQFNCNILPGLSRKQKEICMSNPSAMKAVVKGLHNALAACRAQFSNEKWNCTAPNGFGTSPFKVASKEAAYVYAISSGGVSHALAVACSKGQILDCGCGLVPETKNSEFVWSGCSDNIRYGNSFGRKFIDINEKQHMDARALMNLHNNKVGRKILANNMRKLCKCHGVSGSCVTKTCWKTVPKFDEYAEILKKKYLKALQVTTLPNSNNLMIRSEYDSSQNPAARAERYLKPNEEIASNSILPYQTPILTKSELVFLEDSPDYCKPDSKNDIRGTAGRECANETHCQNLCCGRGWHTTREFVKENCRCKFIWCCEVKCDTCIREVERHFCR